MSSESTKERTAETIQAAESRGRDPAIIAAVGSVLLSWYVFYRRGNHEQGLFVGLWAPTILAFATYVKQARVHAQLDEAAGRSARMREAVEGFLGGQ